jgi:hypothetical protein
VPDWSVYGWIGAAAVVLVVIAWLAASFQAPGRSRTTTAWVGAIGLYVALLSLFAHLLRRSLANDSTAGLVGFGFLCAMFAIGLVVATWKTLAALRGGAGGDAGAAH